MIRRGKRSISSRVQRRKSWVAKRRIGRRLHRFFHSITNIDSGYSEPTLSITSAARSVIHDDEVRILQANVRGIRKNLHLLQGRALSLDASLVVACETMIDDSVEDGSLNITGYSLVSRKDRTAHGGGILVWGKSNLNISEIDSDTTAEACWTLIATLIGNICVCCCYRPPGSTDVEDYLRKSFHKISVFNPIAVLAVGDFNKHSLESLYSTTRSLGLSQLVRGPTHILGGTLDLVFANSDSQHIKAKPDPIESRISDHTSVVSSIPICLSTNSCSDHRPGWDYRFADWTGFRSYVRRRLRRDLLSKGSPDKAVSHLESVLHNGMNKFIKKVHIPTTHSSVPWWDETCSNAFSALIDADSSDVRSLALQTIEAKRSAYCESVRVKLANGRVSCKQFHRLTKELSLSTKAKSCSIPPLELSVGELITDDLVKAEALAKHFESKMVLPPAVGASEVGPRVPDSQSLSGFYVAPCDVRSILEKLDVSKAAGPSRIGPRVYRELASVLALPLSRLYNNILQKGLWPRVWKTSNICPIHKRKSKRDVRNYRPIALLEIPSRVFERIIAQKLMNHAVEMNILAPDQAAFLPGRCTGDIMWEFITDAISAMNDRQTWHLLQTDIAGAFDRVDRHLLICRLENCGIRGKLLALLQNYLSDRRFRVVCGGVSSSLYNELAAVCQGSCLGPILWLYFFSPIHMCAVESAGPGLITYTFADDHSQGSRDPSLLVRGEEGAVKFTNGARITMESSKKEVSDYSNRARKSTGKCPVLLGLRLDSALSMTSHFDHVLRKVSIKTSQLLRLQPYLDTIQLARCYKQYCWPLLEYGMPGFIHASEAQLNRLDLCQDRFVEITGCALPSLGWRRFVGMMCWLYKVIVLRRGSPSLVLRFSNKTTPSSTYAARSKTRSHKYQIDLIKRPSDVAIYRRWSRVIDCWNSLPAHVFPEEHNRRDDFKHSVSLLNYVL